MKLQILIPQYKEDNHVIKPLLDSIEKRFAEYFKGHKDLWDAMPMPDKMQISNGVRGRSVNEGMRMEAVTITQWLTHVEEIL